MSCRCDEFVHPAPLRIPSGLDWIPRQVAGFPEFRRALLSDICSQTALAGWRAREADDLGVMLLEMWAYLADSLAFYDEVLANEAYLRTARLRPSVRRLPALLGYLPRPAVAASVVLAASVEGRKPLAVPAGTQFRSGGFDGNPPQLFELDSETVLHPLANRWRVDAQRPSSAGRATGWTGSGLDTLELAGTTRLTAPGAALLVRQEGEASASARRVVQRTRQEAEGQVVTRLVLDRSVDLPATAALDEITVRVPSQTAGLWTHTVVSADPSVMVTSSPAKLVLDGLHRQIRPDDDVIVSKGTDHRWYRVGEVAEVTMHLTAGGEISATNDDGDTVTVTAPPVLAPATRITLDTSLNAASRRAPGASSWASGDKAQLTVRYGFSSVGEVTGLPSDDVLLSAPMSLAARSRTARLEFPDEPPTAFVVRDRDDEAVETAGTIEDDGKLELTGDSSWGATLKAPLAVFGNLLVASRGETVRDEILGSGDATVAGQSFTLAKSPLTYVAAPAADDERGVASTLAVWVDGTRWQEVPGFFSAGPLDTVYITRQNDDGETVVTFGDGVRGRRLPSGSDNVRVSYRHGAGAAAPPAGSVTQLARPIERLTSVENPTPARGGAEAESADEIRTAAPRSALLLGRAVSLQDFEAAAAALPGVRAVKAEWGWHARRQRPIATLRYIGDPGLAANVGRSVRRIAEPSAPIQVEPADSVPLRLSVDVEVDPLFRPAEVMTGIEAALIGEDGMLLPERLGIGASLFRSRIFERILRIGGAVSVQQIQVDGSPFEGLALNPGVGGYFDVETGSLDLHVWEATDG